MVWEIGILLYLKELSHRSLFFKKLAKLFKIFLSNPFQSSPSSAILVPFSFRINPLVFICLRKPLFLGFPGSQHFSINLGRPKKNVSKSLDVAPLILSFVHNDLYFFIVAPYIENDIARNNHTSFGSDFSFLWPRDLVLNRYFQKKITFWILL